MKYALTQYFLFGTSLSSENYPGRFSRSHGVSTGILQILKPCKIQLSCSLSAPGRWERHMAAMACTPPAVSGAEAAALSSSVATRRNRWFATRQHFLQKIRKLSSLSPCGALKKQPPSKGKCQTRNQALKTG